MTRTRQAGDAAGIAGELVGASDVPKMAPPRNRTEQARHDQQVGAVIRGGEYDRFHALSFGRQMAARRFMGAGGRTPDQLADMAGFGADLDGFWDWWLGRVELATTERADLVRARAYADNAALVADLVHPRDLVGPSEVARALGVQLATVHQWRHRSLMPAPVAIVTSTPVWLWADVEDWARRTGRLELEELVDAF